MKQQKWYQIDFYVGLLDSEDFMQHFTINESVDKITNLIGDCTIMPCIGSYTHPTGVKINMNSLHIIKFTKDIPKYFIIHARKNLKKIFNQKTIIIKSTECINLEII